MSVLDYLDNKKSRGTSASTFDSSISGNAASVNRLASDIRTGFTHLGDPNKYTKYNVTVNPVNTEEELQRERAENQSVLEQAGNFVMQAGLGEIVIGTLEGFGNIYDGIANVVNGGDYERSAWTKYWEDLHNQVKDNYEIYLTNPNDSWAFWDSGWWFSNGVSIASTVSLMIPAAGWARAIGTAGRITGAARALGKTSQWVSRGLAGVNKASKATNKFSAMRAATSKAARIENRINNTINTVGTAALSRAGENYMEAKGVYDDVYTNTLENLTNMPDEEFAKFISNNPEFANMSKDDIAKEIARKSANTTFRNDWAMLLMDIPQFKAIGKLFGKGGSRATTAAERIAAENARRTLAGKTADELIKNNIWNRTKDGLKYALKHPTKSLIAQNFGEGFEELYQGIQTEKGIEVASKYFDPTFTPRTIVSYLSDGSVWEQGFWGVLGGAAFNYVGRGYQAGRRKLEAIDKKKYMTAEEYENWKRSNETISVQQFKNIAADVDEYINNMRTIQEGKNPFNFVVDPETGQEIIKNGELIHEDIDETQKELLKEKAIAKFVDNVTMQAVDSGTYQLMKDVIGSEALDQYIAKEGLQLDAADKAISQQVIDRITKVADIYQKELNDVDSLGSETNPFITIATARSIARNKLKLQDYDDTLININARIAEANDAGGSFSDYIEREKYNAYNRHVRSLLNQRRKLALQKANNEIGESAYKAKIEEIDRDINTWTKWAANNTEQGAIEDARKNITDALGKEDKELEKSFNEFIAAYSNATKVTPAAPPQTIQDLIQQEIDVEAKRNYTQAQIPVDRNDYENLYNEFARSMDAMQRKRTDDYIKIVEDYLKSAEDLDDAINKIYSENTGSRKVNEALRYLRFGYYNTNPEIDNRENISINLGLESVIEAERNKRNNAQTTNAEAEKEGVGTPPNQEQEATDTNNPSSTGGVQETKPAQPATSAPVAQPATSAPVAKPATPAQSATPTPTAQPAQPQPQQPTTKPEPISTQTDADLGGGDDRLRNPTYVDTSADPMDDSYDTPSLRGEIKARQYIMQVGFKSEARLNEITEALTKGDTSKRDAFLNEVVNYLVKQGFDINIARRVTGTAFKSTVNLFGAMNAKSAFGKLAQQLSLGFSKKAAQKHSETEFMTDKELNEALNDTVDEFLTKYSKLVKNAAVGNGKIVINIESLFDYLLNNEDVDVQTAMYIYNNLSKYIATHDGSKYIFTGFNTVSRHMLSATEFINQLKESKAQIRDSVNKLHISPIELRQRQTKKEAEEYREALTAAHNDTATRIYVEPQYTTIRERQPNGYEEHKEVMSNLNVIVEYKKGNKTKSVKVGILRAVSFDSNGNAIRPNRHQSGFANVLYNTNNLIKLNCDFLFEALIERKDADAKQLFNDIADYYLNTRDIIDRRKRGQITREQANKELADAMLQRLADSIMNNPYITQAISTGIYRFDVGIKDNNIAKARDISSKIAAILFFGREEDVNDPINYDHNSFATDEETLSKRYNNWKQEVNANYEQTYKLQEAIESKKETPIISRLNVSYTTQLNSIPKGQPITNIGDLNMDFSKTVNGKANPKFTPLIMVKNGRNIGEDGTDYGEADPNIRDYSMGYIVYKDNNVTYVAYFKETNEIKDSDIANKLKNEVKRLILAQLSNNYDATDPAKHEVNFRNIANILSELFGYQGLFKLGNNFEEGDITVRISENGDFINILHRSRDGKKTKPIMAFFAKDNKGNPGHAIRIFGPQYDAVNNSKDYVDINNSAGNQNMSAETVNNWINYALEDMFKSVKLNRSSVGFDKRTTSGGNTTAFSYDENTGKFTLNLNREKLEYNNYADFITRNNGFKVNVYQNEDGSFVTRYMNENRITVDTGIRQNIEVPQAENHAVSDMLYTSEANPKRKTADTSDILKTAGVEQDKIDILLGTNNGFQIVTKRITISPEKGESFLYYNMNDKQIHITPKGAMSFNGNPKNAVRLILHENLHRHFNSREYTNAERQRITDELQTVYDFVRAKIEEDRANGKITENLYNQFVSILDKSQISKDQQTRMEEFLVECLTQAPLTEWLNNTDYPTDANIQGLNLKKKSILQKIMDILLDLLGIKSQNIKNNSILAREYVILSKDINPTTTVGTADNANANRGTQPVEGVPPSKPAPVQVVKRKIEKKLTKDIPTFPAGRFDDEAKQLLEDTANKFKHLSNEPIHIETNNIVIDIEYDKESDNERKGLNKLGIVPLGMVNIANPLNNSNDFSMLSASSMVDNGDGSYSFKGTIYYENRRALKTPIFVTIRGKKIDIYIEAYKELQRVVKEYLEEGLKGVDNFTRGLSARTTTHFNEINRIIIKELEKIGTIEIDDTINTEVLNKTKTKIDTIRTDFEARIKRSPNFTENHTYLLDGEPIDYSVTQKIHGKQDLGKWGTPASTLGNTADAAARGYFDNNGVVTDDMYIPNVSESQREDLIADMSKIEAHLDERFGKSRYRVITQEFPIGGTITVNGEVKTIAGTMDMMIYTDTGDIYIYDFKTKRIGNSDGNINAETLHGYKQQVNIYRQIIEENHPELKGKVHTGSLIKFNVDYPEPNDTIKYRVNPNNESQLQVSKDGGQTYTNVQDALIDYMAPTLADNYNNPNVIIPVEEQDYGDAIGALPEPKVKGPELNNAIKQAPTVTAPENVGLDSEGYIIEEDEDFDNDYSGAIRDAITEEIVDNTNSSVEIYAPAIANGATDNAYGVKIVNSMNDFISQFPSQYQADIKLILDSSEVNYTCQ